MLKTQDSSSSHWSFHVPTLTPSPRLHHHGWHTPLQAATNEQNLCLIPWLSPASPPSMSSLAATQADGYYLPPAYYESGSKSKNEWYKKQNSKSGGGRGSSRNKQKSPTVRFELADPCVCLKCHTRIGKGTRFNAVKSSTTESYLSTPIWEFRTSCRRCGNGDFIIRTDPQNRGFAYMGDMRKQERTRDATEVGGITVEETETDHDDGDASISPVDRLEKRAFGLRNAASERDRLERLLELNDKTFGDDVTGNAKLRDSFRLDRKVRKHLRLTAAGRGWKESLTFVETNVEDESGAKSTVFGNGKKNEAARWRKVREASIFSSSSTPSTSPTATSKVKPDTVSSTRPVAVTSGGVSLPTKQRKKVERSVGPPQKLRIVTVIPQAREGVIGTRPGGTEHQRRSQPTKPIGSLHSLVARYGSSSSDEDE